MRKKYDPILDVILSFIGNEKKATFKQLLKEAHCEEEDLKFVLEKLIEIEMLRPVSSYYIFTKQGKMIYERKEHFFNYDDVLYYETCGLDSYGESPSLNNAGKKVKKEFKMALDTFFIIICSIILGFFLFKIIMWKPYSSGVNEVIDETFKGMDKEIDKIGH